MNISKFKAIVFDFDGVIVDSVNIKGEAFRQLYSEYGENIANKVHQFHNENGGMDRYKKIAYFEKILLGKTVSEADIMHIAGKFSELVKDKVCNAPEIPSSIDFVNHWSSKLPCYINSATPTDELIDILKERNWLQYFDGIYGSPQSKTMNLNEILNKQKLLAEDVIFFGDASADLNAATETGISFCGITYTSTPSFLKQMKNNNHFFNFTPLLT